MSEVKPTLVKDVLRDPVPPNTWLANFPRWLWGSSKYREYTWIISYFAVISAKSYEYKISFEKPVEKFGLVFPFVVKTQSPNIKGVFIYGVEYPVRSGTNYGTSFIVSGSYFHFKSATRYKLDGEVFNIVRIFYFSPQLKNKSKIVVVIPAYIKHIYIYNLNFAGCFIIPNRIINITQKGKSKLSLDILATRSINPEFSSKYYLYTDFTGSISAVIFKERQNTWFDLNVIRNENAVFISKSFGGVNLLVSKNLKPEFVDKSAISLNLVVANGINSEFKSKVFVEISLSVIKVINPTFLNRNILFSVGITTISPMFVNSNKFTVMVFNSSASCSNTSWNRFGGEWLTCGAWKL